MIKIKDVLKTEIINKDLNETLGRGYITSISEKEANIETAIVLEEENVICIRFDNEISEVVFARIKSKEKLLMDFQRYNIEFINLNKKVTQEIKNIMSKQK